MDLGLSGKRVVVTGASKGIGFEIADVLAGEGASLAICARGKEGVDSAVERLQAHGTTVVGDAVDVADADAYRGWIASAVDQLGGLDVFVHNASASTGKGDAYFVRNLEIDLLGLVRGAEAAADALAEADDGNICSISTTAALETFMGGANSYSALKAALIQYSNGLSQSLGARGIRANVVSPGPIHADDGPWGMIKEHMPDLYSEHEALHPGKALGTPADVAVAVAFLVSPRARHINGTNLVVDGGYTKRVQF